MPSYPLARGIMYFTIDRPGYYISSSFRALTEDAPLPSVLSQTWPYMLALFCQGLLGIFILFLMELAQFLRLR